MDVKDFYYDLPQELIAQDPLEDRSSSRLLVLDKKTGEMQHKVFKDIVNYLHPGDCLRSMITKRYPGVARSEAPNMRDALDDKGLNGSGNSFPILGRWWRWERSALTTTGMSRTVKFRRKPLSAAGLAREVKRPVKIHSRDVVLDTPGYYEGRIRKRRTCGYAHCFSWLQGGQILRHALVLLLIQKVGWFPLQLLQLFGQLPLLFTSSFF